MERDEESSGPMMEMCTNGGGEDTSNRRPIISGEPLDVEAYATLYKRRTKIMRLLFIASHCGGNQTMQLESVADGLRRDQEGREHSAVQRCGQ